MRPNDQELHSLSKLDLRIILWHTRLRWLRYKISLLRPHHLIIPATLAQITAFILAAHTSHFIHFAAIGNMIVVGIALIPMTLHRPIKAHWVKAYE
jgi:hypothetical protein